MSETVIECVPNFAEGRDLPVIHAILAAMRLPGVLLLDYALDAAHNRSIVTIAGPPTAVCEAAIRAAGVAAERVDLTRNDLTRNDLARSEQGRRNPAPEAHPRIGAADVIPFVPLQGMDLAQCAMLAREAAAALWNRYSLPCYLYGAAAVRPDRVLLEDVRRGQFEGLREAVLRDAGRRPDVGGPGLHPSAGATAVGARSVLIEYRISLDTGDLGIARSVARAVRAALGGVSASGRLLDGVAQVALGIADFRRSSLGAVHDVVCAAARLHKARTVRGDLAGLIPQAAYEAGSAWAAELPQFHPATATIEGRLANPLPWPAAL